jgi:hypothetical protein
MIKKTKDLIQGKAPITAKRSGKWSRVRGIHLAHNPKCAICGGTAKLEVHHIIPFHVDPSQELEPSNLMTLCESASYGIVCHLLVGHLGNYRQFNPTCRVDAEIWKKKLLDAKIKKVNHVNNLQTH